MINNAIITSELGDKTVVINKRTIPVCDWIFEKEMQPFAIF